MKRSQVSPQVSRVNWRLVSISLVYLLIFLSIMAMAYTNNLPGYLSAIPHYDKPGHLILYALPTYLGHRVLNYRMLKLGSLRLPLFPVLFTLFTVTEELIQTLSPHRTLDALDLIASILGILLGWWIAERTRAGVSADD